MRKFISRVVFASLLSVASCAVMAQDTLPYKEGAVVIVTSVRTQPGKFNEYLRFLAGPYSRIMDQAKQDGILTDYSFYSTQPRSPEDPDVYIVETYPNMAVFDTLKEKLGAISNKVFGSMKQADEAGANREEVRKILGTEMLRQLVPAAKASTE